MSMSFCSRFAARTCATKVVTNRRCDSVAGARDGLAAAAAPPHAARASRAAWTRWRTRALSSAGRSSDSRHAPTHAARPNRVGSRDRRGALVRAPAAPLPPHSPCCFFSCFLFFCFRPISLRRYGNSYLTVTPCFFSNTQGSTLIWCTNPGRATSRKHVQTNRQPFIEKDPVPDRNEGTRSR